MKKNKKKKLRGTVQDRGHWGIHGFFTSLLSNIRFSLTFRIAVHYALQLLRTTLPLLLAFNLIYVFAQIPGMSRTIRRIGEMNPAQGQQYTQAQILESGVAASLSPVPLPTGADGVWEQIQAAWDQDLWQWPPVLDIKTRLGNETLTVSFELAGRLEILSILCCGLIFMDLARIVGFMRKRNRLNKSVLRPLREMTDMAATLGASNLSNRINIAGTKNELKDLAMVINSMLDRIELSYNSQKQFVSDASHELRTPIAVIQGYVSMLDRWGKEDKSILEEGIRAIAQETASMKELVESLLFLARHDKKTLLLEMEDFDPCEVMAALHREAGLVAPQHVFKLSPLEHGRITADKNMVKQVMRILCDNAVKYTPPGGVITLGVKRLPEGCQLFVADTGPGIPKEELPKIFNRFYRSDSARKSESGGHGLGLSIARIIVVAHHGALKVRSKVGEGTQFTVFLPSHQPGAPV